jgi:GMP synthase (glutamine-hydrolysing)
MDSVLILDFGSQYTQLIARKIRELGVYSEIVPYNFSLNRIKQKEPSAVVLSGGPQSVYQEKAPLISPEILEMEIPFLGICYGLQLMVHLLGGEVIPSPKREYGFALLNVIESEGLLAGIKNGSQVWMSHGDRVGKLPPGFIVSGATDNCPAASIEWRERNLYGVQFHPEVIHTQQGKKMLTNFLFSQAKLKPEWSMESFIENKIEEIRHQVRGKRVICGLSGGVDSLVTALIVHRAVGDNLTCILVDNGLLRKGQYQDLMRRFRKHFAFYLIGVDYSQRFIEKLKNVFSPERKRKIIGELFIRIFEEEAEKIGRVEFLAQGTIYPDVIESNPVKGPSSKIKSHHNVGGLPSRLKFKLLEPLRELFKDEVRLLAEELGVGRDLIFQHPFPGPGLAVRIVGEVNQERIDLLREADEILLQEIRAVGLYDQLWQAFVVLLPVKSVGVMGDKRTYQSVVVVRLVRSKDGMTADWYPAKQELLARISNRIVNEVHGVNRVVYDITTKPPSTIEWE